MNRYKLFYLKLVVSIGLLWLLLARANTTEIWLAIGRFGMTTWIFNLTLYLAAWSIATFKWKLLLPQHSILSLFRLNFIGQFYSLLLPGQIAGEIIKGYQLGRGRQDAEQIAASVIIDRITGFLGLLAVALGGIFFCRHSIDIRIISVFLTFCVLLVAGLFCLHFHRWFQFLLSCTARFGRFGVKAARLLDAWKRYSAQPRVLFVSTTLGACFQIAAVWINVGFARQIGVSLGLADWCWIFGLVSVTTMLPFTVGGIGLREGSFVGALALLGVPAEEALALSFGAFSLVLTGAAFGGILDWTRKRECRQVELKGEARGLARQTHNLVSR